MVDYPDNWGNMRVALAHDWLTGMRGGEKVLEVLCRGFPRAELYTLVYNRAAVSETLNSRVVHTSPLQHIPGVMRHYRRMLPLFPAAVSFLRPCGAELLISTSHCAAKAVRPPRGARHLCYCFTPMRYAWSFYEEYFGGGRLKALLCKPLLAMLRNWDRGTAGRVDRFVAISRHVANRIRRFYGRDADVVYPPVDTEFFTPGRERPDNFDLVVSALVPYKRIDLAVGAYTRTGRPLKIVGVGSELPRLRRIAGANIEFLEWRGDGEVRDLYRRCRCLVFPGEEDFGIVPLEVQACGRPVVAYGRGGALETVREGVGGVFFHTQDEQSLIDAVERCAALRWDPDAVRAAAEPFGVQSFVNGFAAAVERCLARE